MVADDDRKPLRQHNGTAASLQKATYAELLAEADELLKQVQNIRPAQQDSQQRKVDEEKAKRKLAAKQNQLAVVRVRVRPSTAVPTSLTFF